MPFVLPEPPNPGFAIEGSLAKPGIPIRSVWVGGGIGELGAPPTLVMWLFGACTAKSTMEEALKRKNWEAPPVPRH